MLYTILSILHLIIFLWALVKILGSTMGAGGKVLWILVVFFFPVFGLLAYLLIGRKE